MSGLQVAEASGCRSCLPLRSLILNGFISKAAHVCLMESHGLPMCVWVVPL